jgi:hypothetical protein
MSIENLVQELLPGYEQPHPNKHIWESPESVVIEKSDEMARVRLTFWPNETSLKIEFMRNHYDDYEVVFDGWVTSKEEFSNVLHYVGLNTIYCKTCQNYKYVNPGLHEKPCPDCNMKNSE